MKLKVVGAVSAMVFAGFLALSGISSPVLANQGLTDQQLAAKSSLTSEVNVNTANAEQIASGLSGIGLRKAHAIVDFRKTNGPFKSLEELTQVKGIGHKTLTKNQGKISF